ncbi:MAG TPA: transposase [Ktedonobacteraceae bacterium]|nr:transposase [Ktedonobacteraceae bacterium]
MQPLFVEQIEGMFSFSRKFFLWLHSLFRCLNAHCPKTTFAERLPEVVPFAARSTTRLNVLTKVFAFLVGGELGSRLLIHMGTHLSPDTLLRQAKRSPSASFPTPAIPGVAAFAQGVRRDFEAVKAAFQFPYSNGPTEGFVNRLKCLKRQMYGRGSFAWLRQRMLSEVS